MNFEGLCDFYGEIPVDDAINFCEVPDEVHGEPRINKEDTI
jgi:hypothetical protein